MLFERGPRALIDETVHLVRRRVAKGSHTQHLCHSASSQISERIAILSSLQCCLATFLAQVRLILFVVFIIVLWRIYFLITVLSS